MRSSTTNSRPNTIKSAMPFFTLIARVSWELKPASNLWAWGGLGPTTGLDEKCKHFYYHFQFLRDTPCYASHLRHELRRCALFLSLLVYFDQ